MHSAATVTCGAFVLRSSSTQPLHRTTAAAAMTATQCAAAIVRARVPEVEVQHLPSHPLPSLHLLCDLRTAKPAAFFRWTVATRASRGAERATKFRNFLLQPAAPHAAREPGHAGRAAITASMRRRTLFSMSSCATTLILTMRHVTAHVRILTLMLGSNGNREAGSTVTRVGHARPRPLERPAPHARPYAAATALIVLLKVARCPSRVMTHPFLSSRRSLVVEAAAAQALGWALSPPGHCWTSWQPASTRDSSLPVLLSQLPHPRC